MFNRLWLTALCICLPGLAFAHPGHGLTDGFLHPFTGADHLLAMTSVGLLAAQLGGRALWSVPASFLTMMSLGGLLGISGLHLPAVEPAIACSVIALGALIASGSALPPGLAMALVGLFAIFHGYAHGSEMPPTSAPIGYGLSFLAATALLHVAGIALYAAAAHFAAGRAKPITRALGTAIALAGVTMVLGLA